MKMKTLVSQGLKSTKLVQHHIKYKEIHGVDEVVLMDWATHQALHRRLRKEKKCQIPSNVLELISKKANTRLDKYKTRKKQYADKCLQRVCFYETPSTNVMLQETLTYNVNTGNIYWVSRFCGTSGHHLPQFETDKEQPEGVNTKGNRIPYQAER